MNKKNSVLLIALSCLFIGTGSASVEKSFKKLVIMPFENLGKKSKDIDSIGREISTSLTQSLQQIKEISVIDPYLVRTYYMDRLAFAQLSGLGDEVAIKKEMDKFEKLDVDLVLSGSYRVIGSEIKVMVQLVDLSGGQGKRTSIEMRAKYPDGLFNLEESISEKTAYSISSMFESYYGLFRSFYSFTQNRKAYKLYLMGIESRSGQAIQGYMKALKYFYESYKTDSSFLLSYAELQKTFFTITKDITQGMALVEAMGITSERYLSATVSFFNKFMTLSTDLKKITDNYNKNNSGQYKQVYEVYKTSPYFERGADINEDIKNFPYDIETLFIAWDKLDNFKPESEYRRRINLIKPDYLPLVITDFFRTIFTRQDIYINNFNEEVEKEKNISDPKEYSKRINIHIAGFRKNQDILRKEIEKFNKKYPGAMYTTIYFRLFKSFELENFIFKIYEKIDDNDKVGWDMLRDLKKWGDYCNDYIPIAARELNYIKFE